MGFNLADAKQRAANATVANSGNLLKWTEKGTVLSGSVRSIQTVDGKYGEQVKLTVQKENGDAVTTFCPSVLRNRLTELGVAPGMDIAIKYVGDSEKGAKLFYVEAGFPENEIPV